MSSTTRRRWSAQDKLSILREARQTGQTVSEVCRRHGLSPGLFYVWEKQAQEGALQALRHERSTARREREVRQREQELQRLRAAISELLMEHLELKGGL